MKIFTFILTLSILHPASAQFVDKIKSSGIDFIHANGMTGKYYMPEIIGSGAAFFDYDNDGDMDLYIVQSGNILNTKQNKTKNYDRLYRNDTVVVDKPKFVDVTKQAKIDSIGYGMGVAAGDLNNDGFVDLFVTNYGANQVLLNNGDGTFTTKTNALSKTDQSWSVSATLADENLDGYLDVYVVNYVNYPILEYVKQCKAYDGSFDYCSPQGYPYQSDYLYKNNKDGTFLNISNKSGLKKIQGAGLGVVAADFNNDLKIDYYVANDGVDNHFWINRGNDEFVNFAFESGVAVNMNGEPEASMGVDAADYDNDGDIDLFMTHLQHQTNTLYVNNGKGWFSDLTVSMKLGATSYKSTGFGTKWFDYDNDGLLDLFSANGAVAKIKEQIRKKDPFPFKQSNQIWKNLGNGKYQEITNQQDKSFLLSAVSRGAAFADIDNDGDVDIFVVNNSGAPQFLINEQKEKNNWIGIKAYNKNNKRVEIGALITLKQNKKVLQRRVKTDGSFVSSHDDRVVFGLGKDKGKVNISIKWLNGKVTIRKNLSINQYHTIIL